MANDDWVSQLDPSSSSSSSGQSDLSRTIQSWNDRIRTAAASGINIGRDVIPLMRQDINNVNAGGPAMPDLVAQLQMLSSSQKSPVIKPPTIKSNAVSIPGNIGQDVGGFVRGFIPGLIHFVRNIKPETTQTLSYLQHSTNSPEDIQWQKSHGYEPHQPGNDLTAHNFGIALRNIAHTPLGGVVPGVSTSAALTTPQGRTGLAQHPLAPILDVGAALMPGVKALAGPVDEAGLGTVREALAQGKPLKAAVRAVPGLSEPRLYSEGNLGGYLQRTADALGVGQPQKELTRATNITTRQLRKDTEVLTKKVIEAMQGEDPQVINRLSSLGSDGTGYKPLDPAITPQQHAVIQSLKLINESHAQVGIKKGSLAAIPVMEKVGEGVNSKLVPTGATEYYAMGHPVVSAYKSFISSSEKMHGIMDQLDVLGERSKALGPDVTNPLKIKLAEDSQKLLDQAHGLIQKQVDSQNHFYNTLLDNPAARFHPQIAEAIKSGLTDQARRSYQSSNISSAIEKISNSSSYSDLKRIMGDDEFNAQMKSAVGSWLKLTDNGFDPLWIHHLDKDTYNNVFRPSILPDHYTNPSSWKTKAFTIKPGMENVVAGVVAPGMEILKQSGTKELIDNYVMKPYAQTVEAIKDHYIKRIQGSGREIPQYSNLVQEAEHLARQDFTTFDPRTLMTRPLDFGDEGAQVIPKTLATGIDTMMGRGKSLPLFAPYDKALGVYKFSVLTGFRHLAHMGFGGLTQVMLEDPKALFHYLDTYKELKSGTAPIELLSGTDALSSDQMFNVASGKTLGRVFRSVGNAVDQWKKMEDFIGNMHRVSTFLSAQSSGMDREAALHTAYRTLVDMDSMTPVEQSIIKRVVPFYAFTKHLTQYVMSYPSNHPYRAAILANLAEKENKDFGSGLPQQMMQLFHLGPTDHMGNFTGVDYKAINPFRSLANLATMSGFFSSLNPVAQGLAAVAGIDTLKGIPELYPEVHYDPVTGQLAAKRPKGGAFQFASGFIPEFGALDHFIGLTDRMRYMRDNNPESYRRQLFSSLNLPFDVATTNETQHRQKVEGNIVRDAQRVVGNAARTGDTSELIRYNLVPFNNQLLPAGPLSNLINAIHQASPNISPREATRKAIPHPKKAKK